MCVWRGGGLLVIYTHAVVIGVSDHRPRILTMAGQRGGGGGGSQAQAAFHNENTTSTVVLLFGLPTKKK